MFKKVGKRSLNVDVPADLYDMFGKLCIDLGINKTAAIVEYLKYLKKTHYKQRETLNDKSIAAFRLDDVSLD